MAAEKDGPAGPLPLISPRCSHANLPIRKPAQAQHLMSVPQQVSFVSHEGAEVAQVAARPSGGASLGGLGSEGAEAAPQPRALGRLPRRAPRAPRAPRRPELAEQTRHVHATAAQGGVARQVPLIHLEATRRSGLPMVRSTRLLKFSNTCQQSFIPACARETCCVPSHVSSHKKRKGEKHKQRKAPRKRDHRLAARGSRLAARGLRGASARAPQSSRAASTWPARQAWSSGLAPHRSARSLLAPTKQSTRTTWQKARVPWSFCLSHFHIFNSSLSLVLLFSFLFSLFSFLFSLFFVYSCFGLLRDLPMAPPRRAAQRGAPLRAGAVQLRASETSPVRLGRVVECPERKDSRPGPEASSHWLSETIGLGTMERDLERGTMVASGRPCHRANGPPPSAPGWRPCRAESFRAGQ